MDPLALSLIGSLGLALIELSYFPQLYRLYKVKKADEFSLLFPSVNFIGRILAMIYSISQDDQVFTWGLFFGVIIRGTLMFQVVYYRMREAKLKRMRELQEYSI